MGVVCIYRLSLIGTSRYKITVGLAVEENVRLLASITMKQYYPDMACSLTSLLHRNMKSLCSIFSLTISDGRSKNPSLSVNRIISKLIASKKAGLVRAFCFFYASSLLLPVCPLTQFIVINNRHQLPTLHQPFFIYEKFLLPSAH